MLNERTAGSCPACGARIPEAGVLIEYETNDGPAAFAECPDCLDVVHPQAP